jgi:hypothetical protein
MPRSSQLRPELSPPPRAGSKSEPLSRVFGLSEVRLGRSLGPGPSGDVPFSLRARLVRLPSRRWKDKDLAGVNQIRIADLLPVRVVNDGVPRAHTIGVAAEAPEAVAA